MSTNNKESIIAPPPMAGSRLRREISPEPEVVQDYKIESVGFLNRVRIVLNKIIAPYQRYGTNSCGQFFRAIRLEKLSTH